jgi:dipeptidyl aminopeptidase/acylaminoacyl peptidase
MPVMCRLLACCLLLLAETGAVAAAETAQQPYRGDRLAYVSGDKLYVGFPRAHVVRGPGTAFQPVFSYDGRWLAFLRQQWNGYDASSQLWIARADGRAARVISATSGVSVDAFQWSPTADVLAVQPLVTKGISPVRLVSVHGKTRTVPDGLSGSFFWAPDGKTLAIAVASPGASARIYTVSGSTVRSHSVPGVSRYDLVKLAGWLPGGHGILYWIDPMASGSIAADGMRLLALNLGSGEARHLGLTLGYRDWIAVSGNRLLVVNGGGRSAFYGKHLRLGSASGRCRRLSGVTPGQISFDPAWGPNRGAIAFVVAPAWNTAGFQSAAKYRNWLDAHVLWTAQPDGSGAAPAGAGVPKGVQDPTWTRDGQGVLFVKDGALWLDSHLGAASPHPIARLVPAHAVPTFQNPAYQTWYYGHMDWHNLLAWY